MFFFRLVDESASFMNTILTQFGSRLRFADLKCLSGRYDDGGHKHGAEALYSNVALNIFDPTKFWINDAATAAQPGFLRLVNRASIASFKAGYPSSSTQFTQKGCTNSMVSSARK